MVSTQVLNAYGNKINDILRIYSKTSKTKMKYNEEGAKMTRVCQTVELSPYPNTHTIKGRKNDTHA